MDISSVDLSFLDNVELDEKDKDILVKSVRFNQNEYYMLKFCKYKNKKFATYVKELIIADIIKDITKTEFNNINKDYLKEVIREILKEEQTDGNVNEIKIDENKQDGLDALAEMGIVKR